VALDVDRQASLAAFAQALRQLGWVEGRNLQIETKWAGGDTAAIRRHAQQLVELPPDVIVATGNAAIEPLLQAAPTAPIVFNQVVDPVEPVSSKVWRNRVATSPVFCNSNTV